MTGVMTNTPYIWLFKKNFHLFEGFMVLFLIASAATQQAVLVMCYTNRF